MPSMANMPKRKPKAATQLGASEAEEMASSYHCMGAAGCQGCFRPSPPPSGSLGGASGGSVSLGIMWAAKARGGVVVDKDLVEPSG